MRKILMFTAAAFALTMPAAFAEDGKGPGPGLHKLLEKIDTDKDGNISKAEFLKFHEDRFDEMDTDKDGIITKAESDAHRAEWEAKKKEIKAKRDAERKAKKEANDAAKKEAVKEAPVEAPVVTAPVETAPTEAMPPVVPVVPTEMPAAQPVTPTETVPAQ